MKKVVSYLFILIVAIFPVVVNAQELNTLIPIDTKATVKTEKFDYNNFSYNNDVITFESIKNNTLSKTAVSINILLFDIDKKNIGLVSYCTDKDLDSNYSGFKLLGEESKPFSIKVLSKYFVDGKNNSDVKYIAVMDDNKYCHIGGYTNYSGKTIDEIVNGATDKKLNGIQKIIVYIQENNLQNYIIIGAIGLIVFIILIMIIKSIISKHKNRPINYEAKDEPVEETVDLSYDNMTLDDDNTNNIDVSIGANTSITDNKEEKEENKNDEESDLTKFFN